MRSILPSLVMAGFVISALVAGSLRPAASGSVVAFFPKDTDLAAAWLATINADAMPVRRGPFGNSLIVWSNTDGLPLRLKDAGATLVTSTLIEGACLGRLRSNPLDIG